MQHLPESESTPASAISFFAVRARQAIIKIVKDAEIKRLARNVAWLQLWSGTVSGNHLGCLYGPCAVYRERAVR